MTVIVDRTAEAVEVIDDILWMALEWYEHGGGSSAAYSDEYKAALDRAEKFRDNIAQTLKKNDQP